MKRIDSILNHPLFQENIRENMTAEAERCFCRHDMVHFLDVARIGMIINLEENLEIPKDMVYAAAILHDIGKHLQYNKGIPHEKASAEIAPAILRECGYGEEEVYIVTDAILQHRNESVKEEKNLRGVLYRADKASRACFACKAEPECNWKDDKKNRTIVY